MNSIAALLLSHKLAAGVAVAVLATGATVGTFAAQDQLPGQSGDASSHAAASATARPTRSADTADADANATPRAIKGIPTTNPHFVPDADGTCTAGESAVKTTPAGTQVNVPCQAIEKGDNGQGASTAATARAGHSDETPDTGEQAEATPTPPVSGSDRAATAIAGADDGRAATAVASAPPPPAR